jgi:hypothetical protein
MKPTGNPCPQFCMRQSALYLIKVVSDIRFWQTVPPCAGRCGCVSYGLVMNANHFDWDCASVSAHRSRGGSRQ